MLYFKAGKESGARRKTMKALAICFLVILLSLGVVGVFAYSTAASGTPSHILQELALAAPGWQQVNSNGFGDSSTLEVSAMEPFNGYLYAGTHNPVSDTQIFRSSDGLSWNAVTEPGFGEPHDIAARAILAFTVFNNRLYAGTGRGNASQLWRSQNGTIWAPMDITGFSDPENVNINALTEYGGKIYAGVTNQVTGAQIWSSFTGDNNSWTQVGPDAPGSIPATVTAFAVYSDTLYAAVEHESDFPAQIWRSFGGGWDTIVADGFGDSNTILTGGMAEFGGYLYVGAGNQDVGAQLWRTNDEINWDQMITPGFGDANNEKIETVFVFQNQLYVSTRNTASGIEIWRSAGGFDLGTGQPGRLRRQPQQRQQQQQCHGRLPGPALCGHREYPGWRRTLADGSALCG